MRKKKDLDLVHHVYLDWLINVVKNGPTKTLKLKKNVSSLWLKNKEVRTAILTHQTTGTSGALQAVSLPIQLADSNKPCQTCNQLPDYFS